MGLALADTDLVMITCCNCATRFGMANGIYQSRLKDGGSFWCPNGHSQHFTDNELSRTKKALAQKEQELESQKKRTEWMERDRDIHRNASKSNERRARSIKGHATRLRKRLAQGQCPCCPEVFQDLAAHIAEKHPRYIPKNETEE